MKSPTRLGWLVAILLALSLIAPLSSASAAQTDTTTAVETASPTETAIPSQTPTSEAPVSEAVQEPAVEELDPVVIPAALADLKLYSKDAANADVPGATYAIYDATCTTLLAGPTAVDQWGTVTFTGVAEQGTQVCVTVAVTPTGYLQPTGLVLTLSTEMVLTQWSITFIAAPVQTYDLPIFKEDSETGAKLGGAGITLFYDACGEAGVPVGPEQFTGDASAVDGSAGRTIFIGLIAGDYCAVETTAPDGYSGGASATVNVPEDTSGWTLLNTAVEPQLYDLPIFKEDSVTGALLGGAGFSVFYDACTGDGGPVGPEQFTGPADAIDGSAGRTIFTDLPAGEYCVVEVTPPDGYYRAGPVTVSLPENIVGRTVLNDPIENIGTLLIEKSFCSVDDPDDAGTFFGAIFGEAPDNCILGAASFSIWPTSDPSDVIGPVTTDAETGSYSIDLEAGDYILQEIGSGAQYEFELGANETTLIPVWNLTYGQGSLSLTKIYCKAKYDSTDISFDYPIEVSAAGWYGGHQKCWQGDANFEIWLHGDSNEVISFNSGTDGEVWLLLPVTDGNPHKLVETGTGTWAWFDVYEDQTTYATVTNYFKAHHPWKPVVTPTATGTGSVTDLPATGSGSTGNSAWYLLGFTVVGIAGLAGIALRRKPAGR